MKGKKGANVGFILAMIFSVAIIAIIYVYKSKSFDILDESKNSTIYLWYSDEALTDYLNSVALSYFDEKGVKVVPVYHTELEYIEAINEASISGNRGNGGNNADNATEVMLPDLYIAGTDVIEKAAMSGLAIPVSDPRKVLSTLYYPQVALDAITYKGESFGYPFYYETAFLLYNETYLKELAAGELKLELARQLAGLPENVEEVGDDDGMADIDSSADPMSLPEGVTQEAWDAAIIERVPYLVPKSIQDLLTIAGTHSSPANVESFLCWDVSDIFYNYFFTGAYMNIGGVNGDDKNVIDICNEDTIACMAIYQILNQYFSIDSATSSYDEVIQHFINGEYIYTIATSDAIAILEEAKANGTFEYDYNVAMLPSVDNVHEVKGLSYTDAILINGYTNHRNEANDFAAFLAYNNAGTLYERTGKLPVASTGKDYENDKLDVVREVYAKSVPLPKIIELSNFWLKLEQAYTLIWDGNSPEDTLTNLSDDMNRQLGR